MILLVDSRQQEGKHATKERWFATHGVELRRTKLYVGDYTLPTDQSVCIDTKKDIQELVSDICGKQHTRFRAECERAKEAGIQLIILVENRGGKVGRGEMYNTTIRSINELHKWANPRLFIMQGKKQKYPRATRGVTLMRACMTMTAKYGVRFLFCTPEESAAKIVELLTSKGDENA